ncbi:trans-sialidase, putative, partial [Trypanosoma cruzi]
MKAKARIHPRTYPKYKRKIKNILPLRKVRRRVHQLAVKNKKLSH